MRNVILLHLNILDKSGEHQKSGNEALGYWRNFVRLSNRYLAELQQSNCLLEFATVLECGLSALFVKWDHSLNALIFM